MGLFAGQKWYISGNPGNTLSGYHLSVRSPSVCSQGMPCQVFMVWNAGDGPWWAPTAENERKQGSVLSYLSTNLTQPND